MIISFTVRTISNKRYLSAVVSFTSMLLFSNVFLILSRKGLALSSERFECAINQTLSALIFFAGITILSISNPTGATCTRSFSLLAIV